MKAFAESFFKYFGAEVESVEDELIVDLPPELSQSFGKSRLYLVFPTGAPQSRELSPAEDLLVYGSRTFERMLTLLAGRGERAYLCLPSQIAVGADALPLPLGNCRLVARQAQTKRGRFYIVNFRVIYVSDEKQEAFVTIVLDAEGRPTTALQGMLAGLDVQLLPQDQQPQFEPELLRRALAEAEELAYQQANMRAAELEAAVQPRLEKVLLRLTAYYRRLMNEVNTGDPERDQAVRTDLQQDLERSMADELERHRLRVRLSPVSFALAEIPVAHYQLELATDHSQQAVTLTQNLHTGQVWQDVVCHHCRAPLDHLSLCDRGHVAHSRCLGSCHGCSRYICGSCELRDCAICGRPVCGDCAATCAYDKRWLCAGHIERCAICANSYCPDHSFRCRWCKQVYCTQCGPLGVCATCTQALAGPKMDETPNLPPIEGLKPGRYGWGRAENELYVIHIGDHFWWGRSILVMDKADEVVYWRKIGAFERIFRLGFR